MAGAPCQSRPVRGRRAVVTIADVPHVRALTEPDRGQVNAFLLTEHDQTLFLQGNLAASGFEDTGERYGGAWVGAFEADRLVGVAALFWNGNAIVYAPGSEALCVEGAWRASGRHLQGILGPHDQVAAARRGLGLEACRTTMSGVEVLYGMDLAALRLPGLLGQAGIHARPAKADDIEALVPLLAAYMREALGEDVSLPRDAPQFVAQAQRGIERGARWVLYDGDHLVSTSGFNTETSRCVQIGGVFTPKHCRSRGYGAAVVAASLRDARQRGIERSVLFTAEANTPARRCYEGLGYEAVGDYCITHFAEPVRCPH